MGGSDNRRDAAFEADVELALTKLDWEGGGDTVVGGSVFDDDVKVAPRPVAANDDIGLEDDDQETVMVNQSAFESELVAVHPTAPVPPQVRDLEMPRPTQRFAVGSTERPSVVVVGRMPAWIWGAGVGAALVVIGLAAGWMLFGRDRGEPASSGMIDNVAKVEPTPPRPPPSKPGPPEPPPPPHVRKVVEETPTPPPVKPPVEQPKPATPVAGITAVKSTLDGEVSRAFLTTARPVAAGENLFEVVRVTKDLARAAALKTRIAQLEKIMNQKYSGSFVPASVIEASDESVRVRKQLAATVNVQRVVIKAARAGRAEPRVARGAAVRAGTVLAEITP
ncbi:MAG: hypothetical protein ABI867_14375 [Kofleriaceae bacterium]